MDDDSFGPWRKLGHCKKYASNLGSLSHCVLRLGCAAQLCLICERKSDGNNNKQLKYPNHKKRWQRRKKNERKRKYFLFQCKPHYRKTGALYTDFFFSALCLVVLLSVLDSRLPPAEKSRVSERERSCYYRCYIYFLLLDGIQVLNSLEIWLD